MSQMCVVCHCFYHHTSMATHERPLGPNVVAYLDHTCRRGPGPTWTRNGVLDVDPVCIECADEAEYSLEMEEHYNLDPFVPVVHPDCDGGDDGGGGGGGGGGNGGGGGGGLDARFMPVRRSQLIQTIRAYIRRCEEGPDGCVRLFADPTANQAEGLGAEEGEDEGGAEEVEEAGDVDAAEEGGAAEEAVADDGAEAAAPELEAVCLNELNGLIDASGLAPSDFRYR